MPGWDTFAVIIGGAAGALIGLLFVSVSIRIEVISASPDFRNRSAETLSLFTTVLLVGVSKKVAWAWTTTQVRQPHKSDNHGGSLPEICQKLRYTQPRAAPCSGPQLHL